jgi:choice-of-anchor B domain-containing protein
MKNFTLLVLSIFIINVLPAQLNMTYKSHVEYNENLSDVWGYAAPDGREYALVGLRNGVSIVDVTDTENPVLKGYADGPASTWRDIKTFGTYAYVTNETGDGLLVIDLSNLPNQLTTNDYSYWAPQMGNLGTLSSCHNIYIDEFGYAYLVGCNLNSGGMLYVDVFTTPGEPIYVGPGPSVYAHDIYVRDNKAYNSEIYVGEFTVYDVTDKNNTLTLGSHMTPFNFTHNAWLSDDSNYLFTTDEQANAPVAAYDVSDLNNIQEVDQFIPLETLGTGVIPHNVHVWNDYVITSYYTDGCIILDGSRPNNLIEVGNFDTFIPASTGFDGVWGAYPFLPSETVLATDIGNGLYILEPNYVRACWLEGNVTDATTSDAIEGVSIDIAASELNQASTNLGGEYATGVATAGTFDVTFSHPAYQSLTVPATLVNGEVVILDVQLGALPTQSFSGQVIDSDSGDPIPNAAVYVDGEVIDFELTADASGNFSILAALEGDYTVYAGSWGHVNGSTNATVSGGPATVTVELEKGYADDFIVDLDWQVQSTSSSGEWERVEPIGTFQGNSASNPDFDVDGDLGDLCYVTGNGGGTAGNDDVDNGYTRLTTPVMDLSTYNDPVVNYYYWFYNGGGNGTPNDNLTISIDNGIETVVIETVTNPNSDWDMAEFHLNDFITMTSNMRITFESSDQVNDNVGHIVEAGIDAFQVFDASPTATFELAENGVNITAMPNPFNTSFTVNYQFEAIPNQANLNIYNILGQQVESIRLDNIGGNVEINTIRQNGIYLLQIEADGSLTNVMKIIKN